MHIKILVSCVLINTALFGEFTFIKEPIDVVIVAHYKDTETLPYCIKGIQENVANIRRIIVVSKTQLTDLAEWFDEARFPFNKVDIANEIFKGDQEKVKAFLGPNSRVGWIYQQFLKTYSLFVIPGISSNVLIVDSDTVFLRPVTFTDPETGAGLYNPGTHLAQQYFDHAARVVPGFRRVFPELSGISHHMLYQRSVMHALFDTIRAAWGYTEPWKVCCWHLDSYYMKGSTLSLDYEVYFNFAFANSNQVKLRYLKWVDGPLKNIEQYKEAGYDYLSNHTVLSGETEPEFNIDFAPKPPTTVEKQLLPKTLPTRKKATQKIFSRFMQAARANKFSTVKSLLSHYKLPINGKDSQGMTALHYAAQHGNTNAIKLLLTHKARPHIKNKSGKTALQLTNNKKIHRYLNVKTK